MPRKKQPARKSYDPHRPLPLGIFGRPSVRRPAPPRPDDYIWSEPKAECILLDQPSSSLANSRSPKPLFYQPKNSSKTYLIITPYKKMDDESTYYVYKYDIKSNTHNKFSQYPKELDINWPMHFIDYNNDILYVFDSNKRAKNKIKLFWKLNLINGTWTNVEISIMNHKDTFFPKSQWATTNYTNDNKSVNIIYMLHKYSRDYFIASFNFENKEFKTKQIMQPVYSDELRDFPNGKYWKSFKLKDIIRYNATARSSILIEFDHILFLILWNQDYEVSRIYNQIDSLAQIWCLSLLDDSNKWYESSKMLPSYIKHNPNQYFITTTDGYIHFYHKYFYHTIIDLIDVVPKK